MSNASPTLAETLHVRDHCLCLHTQRAARRLARHFDEALQPAGIRSGQFSLMMALNRPDPPSLGAIAELLGMDRTTVTAALKPLQARGLVQVASDKADKRIRRLQLTDAGRECLGLAHGLWLATHQALETAMPQGEASRLRHLLTIVA